jgi:ribosomal protein L13E
MKKAWEWIKNNPNRFMFLIPIILVAGISISHVVSWYSLTNPINWAIYLSIAIEVGAMTALVAATNRIKGGVWFMFGLVTLIQMIGNIFYSYKEIDETGELFKSWVELTLPIWESIGVEPTDTIGLKRWLAFLGGGLLPIISLTSLHFFVKYQDSQDEPDKNDTEPKIIEVPVEVIKEVEKIIEVPVEVIKEVEKIIEVPVEVIKEVEKEVPVEVIREVEKIIEVPVEVIKEVEKIVEVPITTTTTTEEKKILEYSKP